LDVFRIHGSLLAIGEIILDVSEEDILANACFYNVFHLICTADDRKFNIPSRNFQIIQRNPSMLLS